MKRQHYTWKQISEYCHQRKWKEALALVLRSAPKGALAGADLTGAILTGAILTGANLFGANLTGANLRRADLTGANLFGDILTRAILYGANLNKADLRGAILVGANLTRAILTGADLRGANLFAANLRACVMNWESHGLISHRLNQAAGDDPYRVMAAGFVGAAEDKEWCWDDIMRHAKQMDIRDENGDSVFEWTLETMRGWVREGDGDNAPDALKAKGLT